MKKFIFLYYGYVPLTAEVGEAWGKWFAANGSSFVDTGNPFSGGREVTRSGSRDLSGEASAMTGYSIVSAASFEDAEKLLEGHPYVDAVRIYEAIPM